MEHDNELKTALPQPGADCFTPQLISPPRTKTPPTVEAPRLASEPIDSEALTEALTDLERSREHTPGLSPARKRQRMVYGDRFIPNREGRDLQAGFQLLHEDGSPATPSKSKRRAPHNELHFQKTEEANRTYVNVLRAEMFDDTIPTTVPSVRDPYNLTRPHSTGAGRSSMPPPTSRAPTTPRKNLFSYTSPRHLSLNGGFSPLVSPSARRSINMDPNSEVYNVSPIKFTSQQMLLTPRKQPRTVSKVPYKVLDAPELQDDFYLNLVDWGSSNTLGVGLGSCVYMWNSETGKVQKLCDLQDDTVTSVNWIQRGSHLAIGTGKGLVQIWDADRQRKLRVMTGHTQRVGALAWNEHILSSGSRDRTILHRDVRSADQFVRRLTGHRQEVCGLKWNGDDRQLASGGNDNKLIIWDALNETPLYKFSDHNAAVKAIAWSPHQSGLLASGGGTADRRIRFWNTRTGVCLNDIDTGSQVCNLAWSKNSNELVSTHGYSQNQVVVWKYPSMTQVVSLTGHTYRVLYLAMSPDGEVIVTGAGDETLRFWNCFKRREPVVRSLGRLDEWGSIR